MNRIELSTIGGNVSLGGGGRAPKPEDCMKDCIAWYSPKRQGITNEYLQDHYLDDDAVLQDLSGNGNDIALHNMEGEEGGGYVNEDGDLVFDGVDDYGKLNSLSLPDSAAFATNIVADNETLVNNLYQWAMFTQSNYMYLAIKQGANNVWNLGYGGAGNSSGIRISPADRTDMTFVSNINTGECPNIAYEAKNIMLNPSGTMVTVEKITNQPLWICNYGAIYTGAIFKNLLFFRRNLTHEEAEWVYDNILTTDTNNSNS